ncbi:DUF5677 domain-containing protein [Maridesulfovibrio bastinii]|uniref:DUF5677 domain-containing protein n=1 Tax=Maridesulfovibrio bastinii TaxID=47157 RepID=UPI0003FF61BE|nr:DUF5677 domain-containing protein [Maridesulfovibrio bastinii]
MLNQFEDILQEVRRQNPQFDEDIGMQSTVLNRGAEAIVESRKSYFDEILKGREGHANFVDRNIKRWEAPFLLLELLIASCIELGSECSKTFVFGDDNSENLHFDVLRRLHGNACLAANEIMCLLKNGFADAAFSRWRSLHEISATMLFIDKHGAECSRRYYDYDVVESCQAANCHEIVKGRINEAGFSADEIEALKKYRADLLDTHGQDFSKPYGWATPFFPLDRNKNPQKVVFGMIEKAVKLDHFRPYYKWASQNVHPMSKSMHKNWGRHEVKGDVIQVGPSNSGMTVPGHSTALSLIQATSVILQPIKSFTRACHVKALILLADEIGSAFLDVENSSEK